MSCEVYANGDEISCKAGDGKVIAAFPDVCLSPPSPPAGPIPVPYPNTSFSKDMKNGSKTVKIKGQEVMLKDQSFYKSAPLGDEAATQGLGAGVITHVITGKTYFVAWSMDVKFEGQNVDRHTDLTTSNHASPMANGQPPNPNTAAMAAAKRKEDLCAKRAQKIEEAINRDVRNPDGSHNGIYGLKHRFSDQVAGSHPPGSTGPNSWENHDTNIRQQLTSLNEELNNFDKEGCTNDLPPGARMWAGRSPPREQDWMGRDVLAAAPP
ncbi:MAG: DUF4150 domain-containing protein [Pirellulaceae bacterium]|nr:DUF4150 domain-containing protein [Pirellulaceae bacterium]